MGALFGDAAVLDDQDAVGALDGAQAVGKFKLQYTDSGGAWQDLPVEAAFACHDHPTDAGWLEGEEDKHHMAVRCPITGTTVVRYVQQDGPTSDPDTAWLNELTLIEGDAGQGGASGSDTIWEHDDRGQVTRVSWTHPTRGTLEGLLVHDWAHRLTDVTGTSHVTGLTVDEHFDYEPGGRRILRDDAVAGAASWSRRPRAATGSVPGRPSARPTS